MTEERAGATPLWLRRLLVRVTVRTRITLTFALLMALALGVAGVLVYVLETARIEGRVNAEIDQEIAELEAFRQVAVDPQTAAPVRRPDLLLELFLARNVPAEAELLIGYTGTRPAVRSPNALGSDVVEDPEFAAAVAGILQTGGTRVLDLRTAGEVWVTVVPVRNNASAGALVIANLLDTERRDLNETMRTYAVVAALSLVLLTALAALQSGRLLAPLRVLRETANDITATDLSRRIPETGNDDITALTRTINMMLARLEAGFVRQREFLDDAGHELKTPLTVLRGHLELLDTGRPEDVAATRDLLLDETDRMARLVGDLIVLAKSQRPDFLRLGSVDVDGLLEAVCSKATGLGDRDWRVGGSIGITAVLDEQRITQALLQFAANAAKHTEPRTPVVFAAALEGSDLLLEVRDQGPGVPEADAERIFERFGRSAVPSGDEGFGLGLSIVRAIALAHSGTAYVEQAEPRGARFVIRLPLVRATTDTEETPWLGS